MLVHVYEMVECMYADFGCVSIKRLGACMWKHLGAKYAAVGCKFHTAESLPDSR